MPWESQGISRPTPYLEELPCFGGLQENGVLIALKPLTSSCCYAHLRTVSMTTAVIRDAPPRIDTEPTALLYPHLLAVKQPPRLHPRQPSPDTATTTLPRLHYGGVTGDPWRSDTINKHISTAKKRTLRTRYWSKTPASLTVPSCYTPSSSERKKWLF
jgi:hypothetical protein